MSELESPARIDFESEVQTALEAAADDESHVEEAPAVYLSTRRVTTVT